MGVEIVVELVVAAAGESSLSACEMMAPRRSPAQIKVYLFANCCSKLPLLCLFNDANVSCGASVCVFVCVCVWECVYV